jgi:hypothetical protein
MLIRPDACVAWAGEENGIGGLEEALRRWFIRTLDDGFYDAIRDILKRSRERFRMQLDLDPARLGFMYETWASTNMARRYDRAAPRGERTRAAIPRDHWKITTFVAGLRLEGVVAPLVFDGPINDQAFEGWVEQFFAPTLRPASVAVMNNLSGHKGAASQSPD